MRVSVAQGTKSRLKQVAIEGDAGELARLIETRLAALAREKSGLDRDHADAHKLGEWRLPGRGGMRD